MISIVDIAKACGVTASTVSRAINGKEGVSEKVRNKIIATCKELGYEVNDQARILSTKKSNQVGLIIPDITSPYYACIAKGTCDYLKKQGYSTILCNTSRDKDTENEYIKLLARQRVSGIIIISVTATYEDLLVAKNQNIKIVAADIEISDKFSSVVNDNYLGAINLFRHMVNQCNCKKIGCILGDPSTQTTKERLRALKQVLEENELEFNADNVIYADATFENGYKKAKVLLGKDIDSIFAINDTVALGVIKYCQDHKIKIPEDIKIAGYDDIAVGAMIQTPLTTVHQRKVLLGRKAAELILNEINDKDLDVIKIVLQPKLIVRKTCGEVDA